jgi:hypothetical protein
MPTMASSSWRSGSEQWRTVMGAVMRYPILKARLGDDGLLDLHDMLESRKQEWKKDVNDAASDRFERRLSEELGTFRVEVAREFALVRGDMASMRVSLLRWMFAFWIGQFAVTLTVVAMILHAAKLL